MLVKTKFPAPYRSLLFCVLFLSWVTGSGFYILSNWFTVEGDFGLEKHPWQFPVLMVHGASAFLMMIVFGALLIPHFISSWKMNRMRILGSILFASISFQIFTAYLLYYLANEEWRLWVSNSHALVGFILPFQLMLHIFLGIYLRRKRRLYILKVWFFSGFKKETNKIL
ncbi:MAG: hypothetical protein HFP81_03440 [Methylococcales symbiont of Hymedesmia sp. n. MRB-2018]|nr:MAG: hypothetical protein HFP78_05740 [Methylococcales symbiont of Hymedesmia sp. n. MRB-2018]KAF3984179.1 MAG: hypothetical protein HFP81_03440 [Methylococcales symbiont of Hymedesmia sp. n. MRB-2018]